MKKLLALPGVLGVVFVVGAQTNPPAAVTNAVRAPLPTATAETQVLPVDASLTNAAAVEWVELHIASERLKETLRSNVFTFVFSRNVRVDDPQLKMTCELLTVTMPESRHQIDRIVAETNVVINAVDKDGKRVDATAQRVVYSYRVVSGVTNEMIELTGNPTLHSESGIDQKGGVILWNLTDNSVEVSGGQETGVTLPRSGTNATLRLLNPTRKNP